MGRPRKPKALHILHGTFRKGEHSDSPDAACPIAKPDTLSDDASWCWDQIASQLAVNGAALADGPLAIRLCQWWATAETCQRKIDGGRWDYKDLCALSMASKHIEKLAAMLGLSPVDRAKLKIEREQKKQSASQSLGSRTG